MRRTLVRFGVLVWLFALIAAQGEVHLAILPTAPEVNAPADLLTASISSLTNIALMERTEVNRISHEQNWFSAQLPDFSHIGQLLRADGLVLLQPLFTPEKTNVAVRLIAVRSGVVLDAGLYPLPLKDGMQWSELLTKRFAALFEKLSVERAAAVPISFLNLRAAVSTPASTQVERSLSTLLYHRLMQERELFILERRELGRLEWERNLAGPDTGEFWSGSYLLEGAIDREGTSASVVTIHARLIPPNKGEAKEFTASGPRRNLIEVANQLALKILDALHRAPAVTAWNPDNEAARYEEEAAWALRWHMWQEAKTAAESAFSLGRRTEGVTGMKVCALLEQARTEESFVFDPIRGVGWATNPPAPAILPNAQEALETFFAQCASAPTNRWQTNGPWIKLGLDALETSARALRHHYFFNWRQAKYDSALPDLRQAARQVAAMLPADAQHPTSYNIPPVVFNERYPESPEARTYEELLGRFGCWWQETPGATIALYENLMASGGYARNRRAILLRLWQEPMWIGWTQSDRAQGKLVWESFLNRLLTSTNQAQQAEGALLAMQGARFSPELNKANAAFWDAATDETHLRFATNVDYRLLDTYGELLHFKQSQARTLLRERLLENWDQFSLARLKHFLQVSDKHDVDRAGSRIAEGLYTPAQARELLPVLEEYARRFPRGDWLNLALVNVRQQAKVDTDQFTEFFDRTHHDPNEFKRLFSSRTFSKDEAAALLPRLNSYARNVNFPEDVNELMRLLRNQTTSPPVPALPSPIDRALHVSRVWLPKVTSPEFQTLHATAFSGGVVDGSSSLITAVPYSRAGSNERRCAIVELDIAKGGSRELASDIPAPDNTFPVRFEATATRVFWIQDGETIGWVDRQTGRKNQIKLGLNVSIGTVLVSINQRVFIVSEEYLAELLPQKETIKLLVSARRNPPLNKLDTIWQKQGAGRLFSISNGMLVAAFGPKLWLQNPATEDWSEVSNSPTNAVGARITGSHLLISSSETLSESGTMPTRYMWRGREALFSFGRTAGNTLAVQTLLSMDESLLPRWVAPANRILEPGHLTQKAWDGTNLWVLLPSSERITDARGSRVVQLTDRHGTLLWFDPNHEVPIEIPLWFTNSALPGLSFRDVQLLPVANGLVILTAGPVGERWFPDLRPVGREFTSIWMITMEDLRHWAKSHQSKLPEPPRREPEMRQRFDQNSDGSLSVDEIKTMRADTNWMASVHSRDALRLMAAFDVNGDGNLTGLELDKLAMANIKIYRTLCPAPYPIGTPQFMVKHFDENRDEGLCHAELAKLLAATDRPATFAKPAMLGPQSSSKPSP
jgi:hypothetical protein